MFKSANLRLKSVNVVLPACFGGKNKMCTRCGERLSEAELEREAEWCMACDKPACC